ncbi:MAG: GNAT family N-acetyltransferase [Bacteroidales bacterium]|nr:GNAT family N-acetyltransferase [Bacteroidales bacterium]
MDEIFKQIGQANYYLSRLTYVISTFLVDFGLEGDVGDFFSSLNTKDKFRTLPEKLKKIINDEKLNDEFQQWANEMEDLIIHRNTITHSLILNTQDENSPFRFHNYKKNKRVSTHEVTSLHLKELEEYNLKLKRLYKEGYELFIQAKKKIPILRVYDMPINPSWRNDIKEWLREEYLKTDKGLYLNIDLIQESINRGNLFYAISNDEVIGFATFSTFESIATINIMGMKPDFRMKGYGKAFIRKLINIFKKTGCYAIILKSIDADSTAFWEKLDFRSITKIPIRNPGFTHYLPIEKEALKNVSSIVREVTIEIWDTVSPSFGHNVPVWRQELKSSDPTLVLPIEWEWDLKVIVDGKEIHNVLIKRLDHPNCNVLFGNFLVITDIKKLLDYIKMIT